MKTIILTLFLLGIFLPLKAQTIPFGMTTVGENLYVDKSEITVGHWLIFYYYSNNSNEPILNKKLLPKFDSLAQKEYQYLFNSTIGRFELITIKQSYGYENLKLPVPTDSILTEKQKKKYLRSLDVLKLPINNISFEQANEFCEWRTRLENEFRIKHGLTSIKYQLPSIEQFQVYNIPYDSILVKRGDTTATINYRKAYDKNNGQIGQGIVKVESFFSSLLGIYDSQGNVSEMTSTRGIAIGGSYYHDYNATLGKQIQKYEHPESWLGFRCIAYYESK